MPSAARSGRHAVGALVTERPRRRVAYHHAKVAIKSGIFENRLRRNRVQVRTPTMHGAPVNFNAPPG